MQILRAVLPLFGIGIFFFLWVAGVSELVGLPVAWMKVRRTRAWRERPRDVRGIDLLERFIRPIIWETGWVALVALALSALLTWSLGLADTLAAAVVIYSSVLLIPAILAGVAISRLDPKEFASVVEDAGYAEETRRGASHSAGSTGGIRPG